MAAPLRWTDELVKFGWLPRLSGAAVKVLLAVGRFWFSKRGNARVGTFTLVETTGLSRGSVYRARAELLKAGLIEIVRAIRETDHGPREIVIYRLPETPPEPLVLSENETPARVLSENKTRRPSRTGATRKSHRQDSPVSLGRHANGGTQHPARRSVISRTTEIHRSVDTGDLVLQLFTKALKVEELPAGTGATVWRLTQGPIEAKDTKSLARSLQAAGYFVSESDVGRALALASDPFVRTALELFPGEIVKVRNLS